MQSPYTLWLHVRELVQLERITFRADLLSEEICSSYCSESDTFLMNFTIKREKTPETYRFPAFFLYVYLPASRAESIPHIRLVSSELLTHLLSNFVVNKSYIYKVFQTYYYIFSFSLQLNFVKYLCVIQIFYSYFISLNRDLQRTTQLHFILSGSLFYQAMYTDE